MTHCLGYPVGLPSLERFAAKLREEFLFEVIWASVFPSANHRAGSYQTQAPREGWHHNESLQRVSRPQVVLFVSYGDFNANFRVLRKDT